MTTPKEFRENILKYWQWLDTVLPAGSHMVITGIADGRVLYETLWNLSHPINETYEHVYDFLNCVQVSPCWGWTNNNETARNLTF